MRLAALTMLYNFVRHLLWHFASRAIIPPGVSLAKRTASCSSIAHLWPFILISYVKALWRPTLLAGSLQKKNTFPFGIRPSYTRTCSHTIINFLSILFNRCILFYNLLLFFHCIPFSCTFQLGLVEFQMATFMPAGTVFSHSSVQSITIIQTFNINVQWHMS